MERKSIRSNEVELILDKWLLLQKIIKEEITLNEIINKQQQNNIESLKSAFYDYYKIRIKIRENFENNKKIEGQNFLKFELSKDIEKILLEIYDPIHRLIFLLRNNYEYLTLLIESLEENKENYDSIVELICHQLYENLLIQNPEHEELLILCYKLISREIDSMNSARVSTFLDESTTFIGKLLKSYTKRQELKTFLTMIFGDIILSLENHSENCLDLDITRIANFVKEKKLLQNVYKSYNAEKSKKLLYGIDSENLGKKIRKSIIKKNDIQYSNSMIDKPIIKLDSVIKEEFMLEFVEDIKELKFEDNDTFNNDYLIEVTQDELNNRCSNEIDENMKQFYIRQLERINKDPDIFTNKKMLSTLSHMLDGREILVKFKENFEIIREFMDKIISSLIDNVSIIPYTMRCVCKIINILITKKFPNINKYERNAFVGEFIFGKCIIPILINPDYDAVISSTILSVNTKRCLKCIAKVMIKINRGIFFESSLDTDYTIFNHYIIEIIQEINKFFDDLIDVTLPKTLENYLCNYEDELKYDYFSSNPEELVNMQSVCFSLQDIIMIINSLKSKKNSFLKETSLCKSIEKISNQENYLIQLVKLDPICKFFLVFNVKNNPQLENLLQINKLRFTFNNGIENSEFIVKQIKYCIKLILKRLNLLNIKVYSHFSKSNTTEKFFIALNQIIQLEEFNEIELNEKIPINWYSLYMTSNIQFLSDEYKMNDYNKLYLEILQEEKEEIGFLNSKNNLLVTRYGMNMRCLEKIIENMNIYLHKIRQIEKYLKIEYFLKNTNINVCIRINMKEDIENKSTFFENIFFWNRKKTVIQYENDENEYSTILIKKTDECIHKKLLYIEKLTDGRPEKKNSKGKVKNDNKLNSHASNVYEFIKIFSKFSEIKDDIIKGDQKHRIYNSINDYMDILKESYKKCELFNIYSSDETNDIFEEIENYMMKKIHKYVYPSTHLPRDREFFNRTCRLSWITPYHLDINKKYINEKLWLIAINYLNKMDEEKSPYQKLKCVLSAYKILNNCIAFCTGKEDAGADDIVPIFVFILVKSKPMRMISNINYIKTLIHPNKLKANYGYLLSQIEMGTEFIFSINHELLKMSKEEFNKNMENSELNEL